MTFTLISSFLVPECDPEVMVLSNFRLVDHNLGGRLSSLCANFHEVKTNERSSPPPSRLMSQSSDRIRNASIFGELPKLAGKQIEENISLHELVFAQVNYPPS